MGNIDINKTEEPQYKTFKDWFILMRKNHYIGIFILGLAFFIYILTQYEPTVAFWVAICIPALMMIIIAYKGFYQHWDDMKKGRSR